MINSERSGFINSATDIFINQYNSHSLALGLLILSGLTIIYFFLPVQYIRKLKKQRILSKYRMFSIGIFIVLLFVNYILYPSYTL